jgi:hypothetical protein
VCAALNAHNTRKNAPWRIAGASVAAPRAQLAHEEFSPRLTSRSAPGCEPMQRALRSTASMRKRPVPRTHHTSEVTRKTPMASSQTRHSFKLVAMVCVRSIVAPVFYKAIHVAGAVRRSSAFGQRIVSPDDPGTRQVLAIPPTVLFARSTPALASGISIANGRRNPPSERIS